MPKGGARNRSGPSPDPTSGRSDRRGLVFTALPAEGYQGETPVWPLEVGDRMARELDVWIEAWRTPQAAAWAEQTWRQRIVAEYVRLAVLCETDANAALIAQLHRYRDQLGLTPAGLKENGWAVAPNEVKRAAESRAAERSEPEDRPQPRRLRVASDGA